MKQLTVEERIEENKPPLHRANELAGGGQLRHLNYHSLTREALDRQKAKNGTEVVTKMTAWEVLADAQRRGIDVSLPPDLRTHHGSGMHGKKRRRMTNG